MRAWRLPGGRLLPGILATCASAAFGVQFLLERLEDPNASFESRGLTLLAVAVLGVAIALATALHYRRASSARDLKRRISLDLRDLPFAGRGAGFFSVVFSAALVSAFVAHIGEGGLDRGDVLAWLFAAFAVALCAALAAWFALRALPAIAVALATVFVVEPEPVHHIADVRSVVARTERRDAWPAKLFNRPPPLHA